MRTSILCLSCALGVLLASGEGSFARADDYENLIDQYLQQMGADDYTITPVANPYTFQTFPTTVFFGVYFQQYPIGVLPPEDLAESNVFIMDMVTENINYLTDPEELLAFFQTNWDPLKGPDLGDPLEDAAQTWLQLSVQFSQDGYYRFSPPVVKVVNGTAYGMIVVERGGEGFLGVEMTIDPRGNLTVKEARHIRPGIRPL